MNYFWGKGWFRITVDTFASGPKTYWFFDPRSGAKGGFIISLIILGITILIMELK